MGGLCNLFISLSLSVSPVPLRALASAANFLGSSTCPTQGYLHSHLALLPLHYLGVIPAETHISGALRNDKLHLIILNAERARLIALSLSLSICRSHANAIKAALAV